MIDPNQITPSISDAAERLVDTRGYSYDDAYRELGVGEASPSTPSITPVSERDAARQADHDYYQREFMLTGADALSSEQQQINHAGATAVMAALEAAKSQGK